MKTLFLSLHERYVALIRKKPKASLIIEWGSVDQKKKKLIGEVEAEPTVNPFPEREAPRVWLQFDLERHRSRFHEKASFFLFFSKVVFIKKISMEKVGNTQIE